MSLENSVKELVLRFKGNLDTHEELLKCFCRWEVQLEGWMKGEFLYFLDNEKRIGRISYCDRELSLGKGRSKVDFMVRMTGSSRDTNVWIELKHWLIGYQKGMQYDAVGYFGDPTWAGIRLDVAKLSEIKKDIKFILVLTTANPGVPDWSTGIRKFNRKFSPLHLESLTDPSKFPDSFFLGLLSIPNGDQEMTNLEST